MPWGSDLSVQVAEEFRAFGAQVDADLTIRSIEVLGHHRSEEFVDQVDRIARGGVVWTMPELCERLGFIYTRDVAIRVGLALRTLGWTYRRKHGGARVYTVDGT
jgi:hypothetical protein